MPCNFRQVRVPCISNVMQFPWPGLSFGVLVDCGRPPVFLRYFAVRDRLAGWLAGWLATDCLFKNSGAATKSRVVSTTNSNSMRSIKTAH